MVAPLMVLNLIMYLIVIGFASWNLNHYINGQTNYPSTYGQHVLINSCLVIISSS